MLFRSSHYSKRNRHPSATYAIQVACQSWNRSLIRGRVKLVRAASISPYRRDTKCTWEGSNKNINAHNSLCSNRTNIYEIDLGSDTTEGGRSMENNKKFYATNGINPKDLDLLDEDSEGEIQSLTLEDRTNAFCRCRGWLVDPRN